MVRIGYQASHEQFSPKDLLELVQRAERAGFGFVLSSDHINPWSESQDNSGFAWSWLGAALQATTIPFSVVTAPGYRYHPAILAQAIATLGAMFPGRFNPCMGSGENLNEHVVGEGWPRKEIRNAILEESAEVMRRLWEGEMVTYEGNISVNQAKLYTLPSQRPQIYGAALSEETAGWLGSWADGLITTSDDLEAVKKRVEAFRRNGGEGKPLLLKAQVSYDPSLDQALQGAVDQWRYTLIPSRVIADIKLTEQFGALGPLVSPEIVERKVKIISRPEDCINWLEQFAGLGFETIILHNVNRRQEQFIDAFSETVLPHFA